MKVVALISGGKDSCYNMMQIQKYGHEVIALANLLPQDDDVDELDSFMYQTVGHQLVAAYAECMGLPLFRKKITGNSKARDMIYRKTDGDEVEDMEILLRAVKNKFPDLEAVSSGAIASDYQRLRVENVCSRLGLVSLSFLWRRNQNELLQEMIDSGIHAILVKVAVIGLNPNVHLGKDLASMKPHLDRLAHLYGINVCGEGGEYETLTLDCPLFKLAQIVIDDYEIRLHSPDTISPVGVLHPKVFHVAYKQGSHLVSDVASRDGKPCTEIVNVDDDLAAMAIKDHEELKVKDAESEANDGVDEEMHLLSWKQRSGYGVIHCRHRRGDIRTASAGEDGKEATKKELASALRQIERHLTEHGVSWDEVLYIHLYLKDMRHFVPANEVYKSVITEKKCSHGVPSRCTVQVPLRVGEGGDGGHVMVDVFVANDGKKRVLHVQSISPWAPSCIGPYSQATLHGGVLHMAGQIPLDPATMVIVKGGPSLEMSRALQSCEAVAQAFGVSLCEQLLGCTIYCASAAGREGREDMAAKLRTFLMRNEADATTANGSCDDTIQPLIRYVVVPGLPKGALVEVQPVIIVDSEIDDLDDEVAKYHGVKRGAFQRRAVDSTVFLRGRRDIREASNDNLGDDQDAANVIGEVNAGSVFGNAGVFQNSIEVSCQGIAVRTGRELFCAFASAQMKNILGASSASDRNLDVEEHGVGLRETAAEKCCEDEAGGEVDAEEEEAELWKNVVESCLEKLSMVLIQSGLEWSYVATIRVYYVASRFQRLDLEETLNRSIMSAVASEQSRRSHFERGGTVVEDDQINSTKEGQVSGAHSSHATLSLPFPILVPVEAVGTTAAADAEIGIELMAYGPEHAACLS